MSSNALSGGAGDHFVHTVLPEADEPVVLVAAEVGEVSEETLGELFVSRDAGAPRFGQHGVVGPVVAYALFGAKQALTG